MAAGAVGGSGVRPRTLMLPRRRRRRARPCSEHRCRPGLAWRRLRRAEHRHARAPLAAPPAPRASLAGRTQRARCGGNVHHPMATRTHHTRTQPAGDRPLRERRRPRLEVRAGWWAEDTADVMNHGSTASNRTSLRWQERRGRSSGSRTTSPCASDPSSAATAGSWRCCRISLGSTSASKRPSPPPCATRSGDAGSKPRRAGHPDGFVRRSWRRRRGSAAAWTGGRASGDARVNRDRPGPTTAGRR